MNRLSNEELSAIRERAEKATEGPWEVTKFNYVRSDYKAYGEDDYIADVNENEDAAFITHARTDIPKLLTEIVQLRKSLETVKSEIEYALYSKKSADVKRFYLENAIRFIEQGIGGDSE